ncbi:hypothetical protein BJX64DRAFT_265136 [Aspergillus heterothallicus]
MSARKRNRSTLLREYTFTTPGTANPSSRIDPIYVSPSVFKKSTEWSIVHTPGWIDHRAARYALGLNATVPEQEVLDALRYVPGVILGSTLLPCMCM